MSEKELMEHLLELTKQSISKAEAFIKLAKDNIATIEETLASDTKKSNDFIEVLFGEELDDKIDNVVNEISNRLDKVYGSNKIVVNVKEVKQC